MRLLADLALDALRLTDGNLGSLIDARINLGLREDADQNLKIMMNWRKQIKAALSVIERDECICPKCGIRHGGRSHQHGNF